MTSRLGFLLALCVALSAFPPRADEAQPEPPVHDSFDGKLHLKWQIVRPDAKHYSLTRHKGKLTITTQKGSIYANNERSGAAKNLFLLANPCGRSADFEVSVCVSDFEPTALFHQAGLILYDDDDNYLKFVWESNGQKGDTHLVLVRETAGDPKGRTTPTPQNKGKLWLRLTRRGQKCEYASSADGKKWAVHGEAEWGKGKGPARIGILAKHANQDAPEIDACFTAFRLRRLARPKQE